VSAALPVDPLDGSAFGDASPVQPARPGPVVWKRTRVQDRPAHYGIIGDGLPVIFVHGWALAQHSYRAVLHRLAAQGCCVIAPALPGFGGTPDLPHEVFHLAGYAAWLEEFIRAVEIDEKVVMVGHSFGGGVAIRTAHDHPELVRSLVLVNSIGGSSWKRGKVVTSIAERPLWDWGLHFPTDVWPIRQATRVLPVILEDALPNLVRNPRSVVRVANLARRADLRPELEELKRRGLPVTVVWGSRDGIIPRESFEALCTAVGTTGTVVDGSHSWLLADPGRFVEVITNDLEVAKRAREMEREARDSSEIGTGGGALRRLLGRTRRSG
jgi:pimeloyl-ACP methyl ester carboxylesterase